ncbi:hypothetical protein Q9233_013142 [Columba guinea]|nr:hypothetical protein Q9233_013142 [Columba guinea]
MALVVFLILAVLDFVQNTLKMIDKLHCVVQQLTHQLSHKMTQLLQDLVETLEQNGVAREVLLSVASQQWCFWVSAFGAGALLLLLWLCWRTRKRSHKPESSCQQGSPERQDEDEEAEEDDDDDDDDYGGIGDLAGCVADHIWLPAPYMADKCRLVEDLVEELLSSCRRLSGKTFKPRLQPAIMMGYVYEGWSAREDNVLYQLLVPLQPPPGHAFLLETDTAKDLLTSKSCLRVQLQCMCKREQLLRDRLCFLHHSEDELKSQGPSLLNTLCTNSYLDIEKTTCWFQMLVKDAWKLIPLSHHCQLTVLPTTRSCKLSVRKGQENLSIQMTFGVSLDDSESFLSLD